MFNLDKLLTPEEKQLRLEQSIKKVTQQGLRLKKIEDEIWGNFRINLLKKATPAQREELIAFWNLY